MAIVTRSSKGSELTHNEMDNNFTELEQRIAGKANASHTHSIANITGLQDELDGKIDEGAVNVANGLLRLNSSAKVPCEFLTDCFDVGGKVATSHLFDSNGKVKTSLLPSGDCDCDQINASILELQNQKANKYKVVRGVSSDASISTDEDIAIITQPSGVLSFNLSGTITNGRVLRLRRMAAIDVEFTASVVWISGSPSSHWDDTAAHSIELVYFNSAWVQIG